MPVHCQKEQMLLTVNQSLAFTSQAGSFRGLSWTNNEEMYYKKYQSRCDNGTLIFVTLILGNGGKSLTFFAIFSFAIAWFWEVLRH